MKIGKRAEKGGSLSTKPDKNNSKKNILLVLVLLITAALIVWVYSMGRKAEETIPVAMYSTGMYKNEQVDGDTFIPYDMLKGEFEKYSTTDDYGNTYRRIVLLDEVGELINDGAFAAYQTQANTIAMWNDFVGQRVDNTDLLLYSYPGKEIIPLAISTSEMDAFKTFLELGDRINITAIFKTSESALVTNAMGQQEAQNVEVFRQEQAFNGILIADMLNGAGESVLDKYEYYNSLDVYTQASLDADSEWQSTISAATILVALTPEEITRYYQYLSKDGAEFHMALPQRIS